MWLYFVLIHSGVKLSSHFWSCFRRKRSNLFYRDYKCFVYNCTFSQCKAVIAKNDKNQSLTWQQGPLIWHTTTTFLTSTSYCRKTVAKSLYNPGQNSWATWEQTCKKSTSPGRDQPTPLLLPMEFLIINVLISFIAKKILSQEAEDTCRSSRTNAILDSLYKVLQ